MTSGGEPPGLRILVVAPLVAPINEATGQIGGAQVLLTELARGLASRGHGVTLLAVRGSAVPGVRVVHLELDESALRPASFAPGAQRRDDTEQERAFARVRTWLDTHAAEFDIVHAHAFDAPAFRALRGSSVPVVHTLHLPPLDPDVVCAAADVDDALMVTVSEMNARAWRAAGVRVDAVVPNGVALEEIPFGAGDGQLLYAGRISPEKGADVAIRCARAAGRALVLAGGVYDAEFFERAVQPLLGTDARHLGRRPRPEVYRLMGQSAALVMPIRWDEPFGLVAAEAQAAGTPVVGYARGALPEVVVDGRTGYLVPPDDEDALVDAIRRVHVIERAECRRNAERFSAVAMVRGYEDLYVSRVRS